MSEQSKGLCRGHRRWAISVSTMALAVAWAVPSAMAQALDDASGEETIVVTGTRLQNQQSIETKREADAILDSISQDEIGRQPDFNIADAVRRVPGVSTVRDEEEGLFLSVRGLNPDFTFVTLDGSALASLDAGNPGRRVSVEVIPSTVISRTDVQKTRTAATDGNTIGGQINFVTRSAFDADGMYAVGAGSIGRFTADGFDREDNDPAVRLDGTVSNTFGTDDQFGIVVAASYFTRDQDEERALHFYDATPAPNFPIWNGIESPQTRWGGFAKVEYRPTDRLSMALSGNYFEQVDDFQRASIVLGAGSVTETSDGVGTGTGLYAHNLESLVTEDSKEQIGVNYALDYTIDDQTTANFRAAYSRGRASFGNDLDNRSDIRFVYTGPAGGNDYAYELRGTDDVPLIEFLTPATASDTDNFSLNRITSNIRDTSGTVVDLEGSVDHVFGDSGYDVTAGLRFRGLKRRVDDDNGRFDYVGEDPALLTQFGVFSSSYTPPGAPQTAPIIDNAAVIDFLTNNPELFSEVAGAGGILGNDYEVEEDILSAYVSLGYESGPLAWNAGLRIESTTVDALGFNNLVSGDGSYQPITASNDYVNALPSAGFSYDLSDTVVLRGAYSRALGRANLPDLRIIPGIAEVTGVTTISGGNPDLDPRLSDNLDLSLEYYFDGGRSLLSSAFFHKRIQDEIFQLDQSVTTPSGPVIVRQPLNAEETRITGIELNLIKDRFEFLPQPLADFGVSANYTFIAADSVVLSNDGTPRDIDFLVEQPEHLANVALFYQRGPLDGRVSYNRTGEFASGIDTGNPDGDAFIAAFDTIDAQLRWRFTDHVTVILDGRNLTDEESFTLTGPGASLIEDYSRFGQAFFIGLTVNR